MLYVILTIYNEEKSIPVLIGDIRRSLKKGEYEIIAVDDGSYDNSSKILESLMGEDMIIIRHRINFCIGTVFLTGFNKALERSKDDNDIVVVMECDQTSDIGLLKTLIDKIEKKGNDIAIASRYARGGGYVNFPFTRKIYSVVSNCLLANFFPIRGVRDYTIFYRGYRVKALRNVVDFFGPYNFIQSQGFVSNSELLIKASFFTDKISEVPFTYNYGNKKGKSKLRPISNIFGYLSFIVYMKKIAKKVKEAQTNASR